MVVRFQAPVAFRHRQSEAAEFSQPVDDLVRDHPVFPVNGLRHRRDPVFGELAKGFPHERLFVAEMIHGCPTLPRPDGLTQRRQGGRLQVLVGECRCAVTEVGQIQAECRRSRTQPIVNVGHGVSTEDVREGRLEGRLVAGGGLQGVVEHGSCCLEFRPGEGQVVDLHLHLVHVPAREMRPAPLDQRRGRVDDASCSIHWFPLHRQQCCNGRF